MLLLKDVVFACCTHSQNTRANTLVHVDNSEQHMNRGCMKPEKDKIIQISTQVMCFHQENLSNLYSKNQRQMNAI